ncbi:MAG TPA: alpha/beta hydrolase [Herbaspirillum sp.]
MSLFLRYLPAAEPQAPSDASISPASKSVLYVHGATFPSALSVAHRFDGKSWRDALCEAGFDVWAFDFYGFGHSDRYPQMAQPPDLHAPLCDAADGEEQLAAAIRFILGHQGLHRISLISHSWGAMPAGRLAGKHPELIDRWLLFAPIGWRKPRRYEAPHAYPGWRIVTLADQWARFIEDVPQHEPPVLSQIHFEEWGECYLDSDEQSRRRDPAGVKTPLGPFADIIKAWHGQLSYDPELVRCPTAIVRGEWDGLVTDKDARWLFDALKRSPVKRDIKIARSTHLMHLEAGRFALWQESITFLLGGDVAPVPI